MLAHWNENQIYRIDHYLGKETVQNILAFRFSNGMFEPLWNKHYIDNIQFNVAEAVDVEGRGGYYDSVRRHARHDAESHVPDAGVPVHGGCPGSFGADAIRNEKAKLLQRRCGATRKRRRSISYRGAPGQYGPSLSKPGYRPARPACRRRRRRRPSRRDVCALRLHIDNWRWEGVPVYLRSGKGLWKRGSEIVVQFKKARQR